MANPTPDIDSLRRRFSAHAQAQVFACWDRLDAGQQAELLAQATKIAPSLAEWARGCSRAMEALRAALPGDLAPAAAIPLPEHGGDARRLEEARQVGQEVLRAGRVGIFVVAGGQGTRLGFPRPKGAFPIGPVTSRSLFEIQAQKIRGLARRIGHAVPWYIMTSPATDTETRALFEDASFFGLDPADIQIFSQGTLPACDLSGRMFLESPSRISESPNGHGGALLALCDSGALLDMERRGIDRVFYYQVDNPLVRIGDSGYLGFHELESAEMSCKVIRKADPLEKVGVVATIGGQLGIVEYTELGDRERNLRDAAGNLAFWAGNIAIHVFNTDFIRRVRQDAERWLPLHASAKKIQFVDAEGRTVAPDEPNGYKLERFVFDALPAAKRVCVLEVRAEEEFSPIKNTAGSDSPESSRRSLGRLYRSWLEKAGIEIPEDVCAIEIDHAVIDSAEEAAASGFARADEAGDVIRVATGMDA